MNQIKKTEDERAARRLKRKVIERWENEGGKILREPEPPAENSAAGEPSPANDVITGEERPLER